MMGWLGFRERLSTVFVKRFLLTISATVFLLSFNCFATSR